MRPITFTSLICALLMFMALPMTGQITTNITPSTITEDVGNTVDLDVEVTGFTNIISVQFPISYESTVLQFVSADNFALPGFGAANYNDNNGKITISWFVDLGSNPNGITLPAGTTLMTLHFQVVANGSSAVNLAALPPGIEFIDDGGNPVNANYQSGGSMVTGGSGGPPPITGFHIICNGDSLENGDNWCMPVTVNDFDEILSMQYAMHWDPTVLEFDATSNYQLAYLSNANFGGNTAGGTLLLSWYDQDALGITLPDGDTIYSVCFNVIGDVGDETDINIDGVGFPGNAPAEIVNGMGQDIYDPDVPIDGTVVIIEDLTPTGDEPTFNTTFDTTVTGNNICMPVIATNFDSLLSAQFAITYDDALLTFTGFEFGANPLTLNSGANFNTNNPGEIRFTWNDGTGLGINLPDSTVIFEMCFDVIGAGVADAPLTLGSLPGYPVEVAQEPTGVIQAVMESGNVHILDAPPPLVLSLVGSQDVDCNGDTNGSIDIQIDGGVNPYTIEWEEGANTYNVEDLVNIPPGDYNVTVTDGMGQTATLGPITVFEPAALEIPSNMISITDVNCFNGSDGIIDITVEGGTTPYSFIWSNNSTGEDLALVPADANYTVVVTDDNGCTAFAGPLEVSQPTAIDVSVITQTDVVCKGESNGSVQITVSGGTPGYTGFEWRNQCGNGGMVSNLPGPANLSAGCYNVTVTDANGCTAKMVSTLNIGEPAMDLEFTHDVTDITCPDGADGGLCVTPTGGWGGYSVSWTGPNGNNTGACINSLAEGDYTPVVEDQNGCTATMSAIELNSPPSIAYANLQVIHVDCANSANGSISLDPIGGNGGTYQVTWNGGLVGESIGNLDGGMYTPTIRDNKGCTQSMSGIMVEEPDPIDTTSATIIHPSGGMSNGSIDLVVEGGTMPYEFEWTDGNGFSAFTEDINNLPPGNYSVTITDDNDCSFQISNIELEETNPLLGWMPIDTTNACSDNGSFTFKLPAAANAPFVISWGGNTQVAMDDTIVIENLAPGIYEFTISDLDNNEVVISQIPITQLAPATVAAQFPAPEMADCDNPTNFIQLVAVPAGTPMLYEWDNGSQFPSLINISNGTYTVICTNLVSGCTAEYTYELTCPPIDIENVGAVTDADCAGDDNGAISINFTGGDGPNFTFDWTGPGGFTANTQNISNLAPGQYNLTITDESNMTFDTFFNVNQLSNLALTNVTVLSNYGGFDVSGPGNCDGEATVSFSGGVGIVDIAWSNGEMEMVNETLCAGAYMVTVTDELGCTSVWNGEMTSAPGVQSESVAISNYNGFNISCNGECDGIARVFVNNGTGPFTIQWPTGQIEEVDNVGDFSQASNLCGGTYDVTITDINNNSAVQVVALSEPDPLTIEFANIPPSTFSRCDGEIIATTPGAVGVVELTWTASITGQTGFDLRATGLCSGERVQYVVRDANGCLAIATDTVPYPEDGCFRVRPVLTPGQQDGKNDFMLITCIESVPNDITIYNRWGQLVFETQSYNNNTNFWDGTNNGRALPEGVYFYILNYTDPDAGPTQVKGYVNLLR